MKEVLTTKRGRKIIYVLSIVLFLVTVMLISNIASTNKTLERIKENAREMVIVKTSLEALNKRVEFVTYDEAKMAGALLLPGRVQGQQPGAGPL